MNATLAAQPPAPPGTRPGRKPGVVLLLCQCCPQHPHVLAEVQPGRLIIQPSPSSQHGERHYVVLGPDLCDTVGTNRKIWCACCDRESEPGKILAECLDGLLIIRGYRHQRPHFVALAPQRLRVLLAGGREEV